MIKLKIFIPADMETNPNSYPKVISPPKNGDILDHPLIIGQALRKFNKTTNRSLEQLMAEDAEGTDRLLKDLLD